MAINKYEQIFRILKEHQGIFLTAREIYDLVVERCVKRNGLKGPRSVQQILRRYKNIERIRAKGKSLLYRLPK